MGFNFLFIVMLLAGWKIAESVQPGKNDVITSPPKIESMFVRSTVRSNYAKVSVRSTITNDAKISKDASFTIQLPVSAFISNFTMQLGKRTLTGIVKTKEQAKKDFQESLEQGKSSGHVMQEQQKPGRDMEIFSVIVNVASESSTVFELTYEELIEKKIGAFVHRIHIEPGQIVPNFLLVAVVFDKQGVFSFEYLYPGQETFLSTSSSSAVLKASDNKRIVLYEPNIQVQKNFRKENKGIKGDFVIRYDLKRGDEGGTIYYDDRNFVHYFSPSKLEVMDKNIVFIIDISGSMANLKIKRTRESMLFILDKLRINDYFNIMLFADSVHALSSEPMLASKPNVEKAKTYVRDHVHAKGSTNIERALLSGLSTLDSAPIVTYRSSIIVFLTDGNPTVGLTDRDKIREIVRLKNNRRASIFSLGFGDDVDFEFLQILSLQNNGRGKKIYVDDDAAEQLRGFYEEIDSPLLTNVKLIYESNVIVVDSLTRTSYPQYFKGTEILSVGQIKTHVPVKWEAFVTGKSRFQNVILKLNNKIRLKDSGFLDRLFAYWKIKDLLEKEKVTEDRNEKALLNKEILNMSLSYNFVTPVTSIIVTETIHRPIASERKYAKDLRPSYKKRGYTTQISKRMNFATSGGYTKQIYKRMNFATSGLQSLNLSPVLGFNYVLLICSPTSLLVYFYAIKRF